MSDHVIIDGVSEGLVHNVVFEGTHQECLTWIYDKSFDYQILEKTQVVEFIKQLNQCQ